MPNSIIQFIFREILYRPFLNLLVFIYNYLPMENPNMGVALIVFTLLMSLLLLPISLKGGESDEERRELLADIKKVEKEYKGYPVKIREKQKKLVRAHRGVFRWWYISIAIYIAYFAMLYRIFKTGLIGSDLLLLYDWVSKPVQPLNLVFLGKINMVKPSPMLNLLSAGLTFAAEGLAIWFSPFRANRDDWLVLFLAPVAAFSITYRIPSGQELFFTVSLVFVVFIMLAKELLAVWKLHKSKKASEKIVYGKVVR